jgi:UDP-N-acetylmuramoylalanine--D-glutamate ligase
MGLGLFGGGRGLTEFLCRSGADVTVTDLRDAATLAPSVAALEGLPVRWVLGEHREEDFLGADTVFVNPAVPRENPLVVRCRERGIELDTEMNLFFKLCRGRICAVTGSNGKTTTTALAGAMLRRAFATTRVGGNIGVSLLGEVEEIGPEDWVVLELSSFQLEDLAALARRPEVALVTNLSPNHLNRHGTYAAYLAAKRVILEGRGWAVLNGDDALTRSWAAGTGRRVCYFGRAAVARPRARGVWFEGDEVAFAAGATRRVLFTRADIALKGDFNLVNAAGAAAAAIAAGCPPTDVLGAVREFRPIEHRLELVRELDGVEFYNDSIATTPESTLCAIAALGPEMVVIAGGSDKGSSFAPLARALARRTRGVVLLGATAPRIAAALFDARAGIPVRRAGTLEEAVHAARELARPGDRVVLSPACASFDMFTHFGERGRRFKEIVAGLAGVAGAAAGETSSAPRARES